MTAGDASTPAHDWAARQVTGDRVLLVGANEGGVERELARTGRTVVTVASLRGAPWTLESGLLADRVVLAATDAGFESIVIVDVLADHPSPGALLRDALEHAAPGARLVVTVPYGTDRRRSGRHVGLAGLVELLRPLAVPEQVTVRDGAVRFVGRVGEASDDAWAAFGPDDLLAIAERGVATESRRHVDRIAALERELERLRASAAYRTSRLLAGAARDPKSAVRLPGQLLRVVRGRQAGPTASDEPEGTPRYPIPAPHPPDGPRIATIVVPRTAQALAYDVSLAPLDLGAWEPQLDRKAPELLLVEAGDGVELRPWTDRLAAVVAAARERGIPTVLWATGDPAALDAPLATSAVFEVVALADGDAIPRVREALGHDRVIHLPRAIQPRLANPHRPRAWSQRPVLAIGDALQVGPQLGGEPVDRLQEGALDTLLAAYRTHRVVVADGVHALDSLACGTPVIAPDAPDRSLAAVTRVATTTDEADAHARALLADEDARHRLGHLAYRATHDAHTYRHRLATLRAAAGLPEPPTAEPEQPPISVILATSRPEHISHALASYARQAYPNRELWLVLNNNEFDVGAIRALAAAVPDAHVVRMEGRVTLAQSMNAVLDRCAGAYVAKMDDDDHYGERYLADLILATRASGAEIVGKARYFTYLEGTDELAQRLLGAEHDFVELVSGATLLMDRELFRTIRFTPVTRGTDSIFLREAAAEGARIYSADRYNFVLTRRPDPKSHTWDIDEAEFRKRCVDLRHGFARERVML